MHDLFRPMTVQPVMFHAWCHLILGDFKVRFRSRFGRGFGLGFGASKMQIRLNQVETVGCQR
jgi:hypothetical protein